MLSRSIKYGAGFDLQQPMSLVCLNRPIYGVPHVETSSISDSVTCPNVDRQREGQIPCN